jgi:hypothetical protein
MKIIDHFENYVKVGFQPIPIWPNSKVPIGKAWNSNWSENRIKILFQFYPNANIGLLLGTIVDVEGDTDEANELLEQLIGNYPHPSYKGSKSIHHLFQNPDKNLTRIHKNGIEFRGYKHQSILPPSKHPDGTVYKWLTDYFFIPPLPPALTSFYKSIKKNTPNKPKTNSIVRKRYDLIKTKCPYCLKKITMNKCRYKLENIIFQNKKEIWTCSNCRGFDIRKLCRKLKIINN